MKSPSQLAEEIEKSLQDAEETLKTSNDLLESMRKFDADSLKEKLEFAKRVFFGDKNVR